jgi:hypothetical protein
VTVAVARLRAAFALKLNLVSVLMSDFGFLLFFPVGVS